MLKYVLQHVYKYTTDKQQYIFNRVGEMLRSERTKVGFLCGKKFGLRIFFP